MSEPTDLREAVQDETPEGAALLVPLRALRPGGCGTVRVVEAADEDGDRLKAMGICEGRRVMLVRRGDPMILRVLGSRIGLSARLADTVRVVACADDFCVGDDE